MRAVSYTHFGGPEVLRVVADLPVPQPGPGQVRVQVAASVVHPVDLMIRAGRFPAPLPTKLPYVPGWDVAGTVDAVGPSVADLTVNDDVIGFSPWLRTTVGAHAEYVILDAAWLTAAPVGVPATEAATLPTNGLAAAQALDLLALPAGSSLLVTGAAGQVGGFTLALARAAGLHATGIVGASDREFVESQGAAFVPRSENPIPVAAASFDAVCRPRSDRPVTDGTGQGRRRLPGRLTPAAPGADEGNPNVRTERAARPHPVSRTGQTRRKRRHPTTGRRCVHLHRRGSGPHPAGPRRSAGRRSDRSLIYRTPHWIAAPPRTLAPQTRRGASSHKPCRR